jgi:uncharacterized repeat protein (TIGR03803 family)
MRESMKKKSSTSRGVPIMAAASRHWVTLAIVLTATVGLTPWSQAQPYKVLHSFTGADGANPEDVLLVRDSAGNIYGTASNGGASGGGTVFKLNASGKETVLHSFTGGSDGKSPAAGVTRDRAGNLYGTAQLGGNPNCQTYGNPHTQGCGVVFKVNFGGKFTVLHTFAGPEGAFPTDSLLESTKGTLYATTAGGGMSSTCEDTGDGCGAVFKLTLTSAGWTEEVLYNFGWNKGWQPYAGLIADSAGNLYGTTEGCNNGTQIPCGTVFRLAPGTHGWRYKMLHGFTGGYNGGSDGAYLWGGLVRDSAGNLYGTTNRGGAHNYGTIFRLTTNGKKAELYSFAGPDGAYPYSALALDTAGNLYGTTFLGGASNDGAVFKLDSAGKLTVLHSFTSNGDGQYPQGPLLLDGGTLYGTTLAGGAAGNGTVFNITP